jgi:hypothetical protein
MKYNNASQAAAIALSIAARARKAIRSSQPSIENLTPSAFSQLLLLAHGSGREPAATIAVAAALHLDLDQDARAN